MDVTGSEELREFLDSWQNDPLHIKKSFTEFMDFLAAHGNMSFTFKARPGVSFSLRARHSVQTERVLFCAAGCGGRRTRKPLAFCVLLR